MKQKKLKYIHSKLDNYFIKKESEFHLIIGECYNLTHKLNYNDNKCLLIFSLTGKNLCLDVRSESHLQQTNLRRLSFCLRETHLGQMIGLLSQSSMIKWFPKTDTYICSARERLLGLLVGTFDSNLVKIVNFPPTKMT
jgi:hypothetical protein